MLASGSRKGHRGEEGEAAVERKAVLGGRGGALACPVVAEGGARDLPEASTFRKPEGLMSCDRVTTQRTQRNAIIVTTCPQSTLRLRAGVILLVVIQSGSSPAARRRTSWSVGWIPTEIYFLPGHECTANVRVGENAATGGG
jgi:hypothetical protein